jgi:hypothetical protein
LITKQIERPASSLPNTPVQQTAGRIKKKGHQPAPYMEAVKHLKIPAMVRYDYNTG